MKTIGIVLGSLVAATASAGACDSLDCPACGVVSNPAVYASLPLIGALVVGAVGFTAFKKRRGGIAALLAFFLAFASTSFAADNKATGTNATPAKITIAELLAKPDAYAGKDVTVKARLADVCAADGCLTLKDKFDVIEGKPPTEGFKKTPKVGATLNVTGTVTVKGEGQKKEVAIAVKNFEEVKK
jgi:hypothetical protein